MFEVIKFIDKKIFWMYEIDKNRLTTRIYDPVTKTYKAYDDIKPYIYDNFWPAIREANDNGTVAFLIEKKYITDPSGHALTLILDRQTNGKWTRCDDTSKK